MGAGLLACSPRFVPELTEQRTVIKEQSSVVEIDSLIAPYSRELAKTMNEKLAFAPHNLLQGRPNSTIGQWICDQLVQFGIDSLKKNDAPIVSIINTGGIRSPFLAGNITVGDVFKVMPFDNQLAIAKISKEKFNQIAPYLKQSGGEPISGFTFIGDSLKLENSSNSDFIYVVTTDYLLSGGDKMTFLKDPIEVFYYPTLLRDWLIYRIRISGTLTFEVEERIRF